VHEEIKFNPGKLGALNVPYADALVHGAVGTGAEHIPAPVLPPTDAEPVAKVCKGIAVDPVLLKTLIWHSLVYDPVIDLQTLIVAPVAAVKL